MSTAWALLGYEQRSRQEALLAKDLSKTLSPVQQLEYEALADEATNNWADAIKTYNTLFEGHPDSIGYAIKLANVQTRAARAQLALATIGTLRARNGSALTDPQVDLEEAAADSVLGNFKGQLAASKQAEVHAEARGEDLLVADAQMGQGNSDDMLDNWAEAFRLWRQARKTYESISDRSGVAAALNHQADLAWKKGDASNARKIFEESISLSRETGDNLDLAYALAHLGIVRMAVDRAPGGEMPEAVRMYREAIAIYRSIGNTAEEGYVCSLLGDEAVQRAHYEDAHGFYLKAMAISQAATTVAGLPVD